MIRNWNCRECVNINMFQSQLSHTPVHTSPTEALADDFSQSLHHLRSNSKLYKRLPKPVRPLLAGLLTECIEHALANPSKETWWQLMTFSYRCLQHPSSNKKKKEKPNVTKVIRENVNRSNQDINALLSRLSVSSASK